MYHLLKKVKYHLTATRFADGAAGGINTAEPPYIALHFYEI